MTCPGRFPPPGLQSNAVLAAFVGFDVELEVNPRIEGPVCLLRPVLEIDLGERQTNGLRSRVVAGVAIRDPAIAALVSGIGSGATSPGDAVLRTLCRVTRPAAASQGGATRRSGIEFPSHL
jgi:hypothetical protein